MSDAKQRQLGTTVTLPIVYGNTAVYFGQRKTEFGAHTHRWTVYLRGLNNDDLGTIVKKVVFKLHESFAEPLRTVDRPPFEVSESGWGEFEVEIKVYFADSVEKPVTLYHSLKLYPDLDTICPKKNTLVNELYDELVFNDPTLKMLQCLNKAPSRLPINAGKKTSQYLDYLAIEAKQMEKLTAANQQIQTVLKKSREDYAEHDEAVKRLRLEIQEMEQELNRRVLQT